MSNFLDELFREQPTSALLTNTGALVDVSGSAPPVAGSVLKAIDDHTAEWLPDAGSTLPNVTNDAQLKRAANDFNAFTQKSVPLAVDRVLIESVADGGAKRWSTAGSLRTA